MVPRYARPAMVAIWEPEARFRITQTAFVQEHALVAAQNRIQELEWELENTTRQAQAASAAESAARMSTSARRKKWEGTDAHSVRANAEALRGTRGTKARLSSQSAAGAVARGGGYLMCESGARMRRKDFRRGGRRDASVVRQGDGGALVGHAVHPSECSVTFG